MVKRTDNRNPANGRFDVSMETTEQMRRIVEMRDQDMTFTQIGKTIGIHKTNAFRQYRRALALAITPTVTVHRDRVRAGYLADLERLDDLFADAVDGKDLQAAVGAIRERRRIFDSLAKLDGLTAPTRRVVEVITEDTVDAAIRTLEQQLADRSVAGEAAPSA